MNACFVNQPMHSNEALYPVVKWHTLHMQARSAASRQQAPAWLMAALAGQYFLHALRAALPFVQPA